MPGKPIVRRAVENDPATGKPRQMVVWVCEGKGHHRFQYLAGEKSPKCPVVGCEAGHARIEERLRD